MSSALKKNEDIEAIKIEVLNFNNIKNDTSRQKDSIQNISNANKLVPDISSIQNTSNANKLVPDFSNIQNTSNTNKLANDSFNYIEKNNSFISNPNEDSMLNQLKGQDERPNVSIYTPPMELKSLGSSSSC